VANAGTSAVTWSVSATSGPAGTISSSGLYTSPSASASGEITVQVTATSVADPTASASAKISVIPNPSISISPSGASVPAGGKQEFSALLSDASLGPVEWLVDGVGGGCPNAGTISVNGIYSAPNIDPGYPVTIEAVSSTSSRIKGAASITIVNPPHSAFTGISYDKLLSSWNDTQLPWIADLAGLQWDAVNRAWNPVSNWKGSMDNIAPQIYYLYTALDPITEMTIAKKDVSLLEELALFHMALLQQRTTTIGSLLQDAPPGAYIFIDNDPRDHTFSYQRMYSETRAEVTECQLCNARYLLSAARLLRATANLTATERTAPLAGFLSSFSGFLVNEQLLRLLYGPTPWSHWSNPDIPQPLVNGWQYLADTGYEPPHPIKYQAAMTDAELWILATAAEVLGADNAAPELNILDNNSRTQLLQAVAAGTALLQRRTLHVAAPDGADSLSTLPGDYDDHPDLAYTAYEGSTVPTTPGEKYGLMSDSMHSAILPPVFQSLYENLGPTGNNFPALRDLVSLGNTYVHLAFTGNARLPDFNNFLDGWNGWFRVGYSDIPGGYPPHQYCNSQLTPDNCMAAGTLQGWGHLAVYNPDLAALEQDLISLANDDSAATAAFKAQHYWYNGPYSAGGTDYPNLMIYIGGDAAMLVH
jgi:hypothetical protein